MRLRALLACLAVSSVPVVTARAEVPATYADSCGTGAFVADYYEWSKAFGDVYLGDGNALYVRVAELDGLTVICLHAEYPVAGGRADSVGGRIVLSGTRIDPTVPTVTSEISGCAGLTTLASGQVGDPSAPPYQPYHVAVGLGVDRTDVCLVANGAGVRLTLPSVRTDGVPGARFDQDPIGAAAALPAMPTVDPGVPSTSCYGGGYVNQTRRSYQRVRAATLAVHRGDEQESSGGPPDRYSTCVRVEAPAGAWGGVLRRRAGTSTGPLSDAQARAVCQVTVFRSEQPVDVHLRRGVEGSRAAVCLAVGGTDLPVGAQVGDPNVGSYEWQPDPA